ncbi:ABC transporter permease [Parapedobacter koreensis]|uniref:Putative ABC transport system permease protein n=1 Tax=Parapedobacter koreensis TaxID=332977 RepID=A0A1H7QWS3_9SPHI|nr:ABC transporter permease [Parapedobacter koreensis]SEL52451.1 putative ABC transport system permease protein [Parapedobacter koreensis]
MIKNYVKTALRSMLRQRAFAAINIVGLAIGIATCLLISLFVFDEWSYDRFHEKADRIVRIVFGGTVPGGEIKEANVMPPTAQAIQAEFPEVEETTRLVQGGRPFFLVANQSFNEEELAFVDANFFRVFSFHLLHGNPETVLTEPYTVILTEKTARKYFGTTDAVGKELIIKADNTPLKVTGVVEDLPLNSHIHFDLFASMASYPNAKSNSWMESGFNTYAVLRHGTDYKTVEAKLPALFEKYAGPQFPAAFGMTYTEHRKAGNDIGLHLQRLTDIRLHSDFTNDLSAPGDVRYVYIFSAIALFMLLIASINFMNLATASASRRAKEVGVRKVLGSGREALTFQFLMESLLLTLVALLVAIGLAYAALPLFNQLSGKTMTIDLFGHWWIVPSLLLGGLAVGLLAGSYPAFFLAAFKPVAVLKGKLTPHHKGLELRSGLVVFQFLISIALIVCTTVVYKQLDYIQHKKLGYDKEQVIVLQTWPLGQQESIFRQQLLQDPRVLHVTNSPYVPAGPTYDNNFFVHSEDNPSQWVKTLRYDVDEHYIPTLGIELLAGRNFSADYGTDSLNAVINETAAKAFGWTDDALGKTLVNGDNKHIRVVGVVKDFHFKSLRESITPLVMTMNNNFGNLIVKARPGDMAGLLQAMEKRYDALNPDLPFAYSFLDERINNTYQAERNTGTILGVFAGLTIFVACLGLFGLATFTAYQRTKEIGIRKVLGATVTNIIRLLVTDFVKLIAIAVLIASPIAWWVMNKWLEDFAYRIDVQWWMFGLAGLAAVAIALLTVGWQAVKAALANPVESLRDE